MQIRYSSRDTIAMTIPNYLQPIIPFHHEYKIRPIRLKLGSLAFLKMHTVTRNNFICNSFSQPATRVRKYIYKAIDRLASMSRSPPKINAESNISQGTHAECKFIPHDSFCLFFHLLTQKNETRSPQSQNVHASFECYTTTRFSSILDFRSLLQQPGSA